MVDTWRFSCAHLQNRSGVPPIRAPKPSRCKPNPLHTSVNGKTHLKLPRAQCSRPCRHPCWTYRHVIWVGICNSIVPLSAKKAAGQALARKGKRGWISDGAKLASRNLKGNVSTLKQNSWDTSRVFWLPVFVRGELHVEALPEGFPGDTLGGLIESASAGDHPCRVGSGPGATSSRN